VGPAIHKKRSSLSDRRARLDRGHMAAKDELGRRGEDEAVRYLERRGLVVLSRN